MSSTPPLLSPDRPESDPKRDLFGYAPFAKQLAQSIVTLSPEEGLVLGIYAPWGSGKSTMLNFVEYYLGQMPSDDQPIIVHFNPWWFSGEESLARTFLEQLSAQLVDRKGKAKKIGEAVSKFSGTVARLPLSKVGVGGVSVADAANTLSALAGSSQDVVKLKEHVSKLLRKDGQTILVVIDDIDRLNAEEIRQLFRVVKAVADFPHVIYLLAFDKEVIIEALKQTVSDKSTAYLEKIIQVPFELPLPDETSLMRMLFAKLDEVIEPHHEEGGFDLAYWQEIYFRGLRRFFTTPREVIRLANSMAVTFPAVASEVDPVDFIAIEAIRIFEPTLYDYIRQNEGHVTGLKPDQPNEEERLFFPDLLKQSSESRRAFIEQLLTRLFPRFTNVRYDHSHLAAWRRRKRVCTEDAFPAYFRLSLPTGAISSADVKHVLGVAGDRTDFATALQGYLARQPFKGRPAIRNLLDRLQDYTEAEIPTSAIESTVLAIFDVADELVQSDDNPPGFFEFGTETYVGRLIWQLMRRLDRDQRFAVLMKAVDTCPSLRMLSLEVMVLGQEQGRHGGDQPDDESTWIVSASQLTKLEKALAGRIREAARDSEFLNHYQLHVLLYRWHEFGKAGEARKWIKDRLKTDTDRAIFLEHFLGETKTQGMGSLTVHRNPSLSPKGMELLLDLPKFAGQVRKIDQTNLSQRQALAVSQFLKEFDVELEEARQSDQG